MNLRQSLAYLLLENIVAHIEAMKQMANYIDSLGGDSTKYRQVIAETEKQEPVAWDELTEEEIEKLAGLVDWSSEHIAWNFAIKVEDLLKEKNHPQPNAEQEPVAIVVARQYEDGSHAGNHLEWRGRNEANDFPEGTAFYTHPQPKAEQEPKREPLTDEECEALWNNYNPLHGIMFFIRSVEAKLKEKNT